MREFEREREKERERDRVPGRRARAGDAPLRESAHFGVEY